MDDIERFSFFNPLSTTLFPTEFPNLVSDQITPPKKKTLRLGFLDNY